MTSFSPESQDALRERLLVLWEIPTNDMYLPLDKDGINLYLFDEDSRISEIGATYHAKSGNGSAGFAYMRSEPESLGVILACEDVMLCHSIEPDWSLANSSDDFPLDPYNEALWRLGWLLSEGSEQRDKVAATLMVERQRPAGRP